MTTTPIIEISNGEFGSHNWTLYAQGKQFYLGQDVKFCHRVLGMECSYIAEQIGSNDLRKDSVRILLAEFIIEHLQLDEAVLNSLQSWELCCQ